MSKWPYLLIEECLYSMCETVICLVTVPIVEESGGFGGNFHNYHRSYLNCTSVPQQSMKNLVHSSQLNEPIHSLLRIDEAIMDGSTCSFPYSL